MKIFNLEVPKDCEKAVKELKRLKVYLVMNDDIADNFSDIWFRVQHECDLYEEGECEDLTYQSYIGAKNWLNRWEYLYYEYDK